MHSNFQRSEILTDHKFFARNPMASSVVSLFDHLPHIVFYVKDRESRFVAANDAMLKTKFLHSATQLLGRNDFDFFPPAVADIHIHEDQKVMQSGQPLTDQFWFAIDHSGNTRWFNSSKVPLLDENDNIIGVAGTRYPLDSSGEERLFKHLTPVVRHLVLRYNEPTSMESLAEIAQISPEQLNRDFVELLCMPPHQFQHTYRIEKARQLLAHSQSSVEDIASETGFYDLDHFYRHFGRFNGVSPEEYRNRFSPERDVAVTP